jgi:hypothetical protein
MAVGTIILGSDHRLYVANNTGTEAAPVEGTYSIVSNAHQLSKSSQRDTTEFETFENATAYSIAGKRKQTYNLDVYASKQDTGQDLILSHEAADTTFFIKVVTNGGVDGWKQLVRCGSTSYQASPAGLAEATFALLSAADPVVIGNGPLF